MLRTILVPLDGSALAEQALLHAQLLAERSGARLVLLRAAPFSHTAGHPHSSLRVTVRDAEEYLQAVTQRLGSGYAIRTEVLHSDPVRAISFAAHEWGVDLIVMSTHGRSGLRRVLLGSVAEAVVAAATVPVLLVRAAPPAGMYYRILVPLDGSRAAEAALVALADLPLPSEAEITLLRATQPLLSAGALVSSEDSVVLDQEYHEAQQYLADVAGRYSERQPFKLETPLARAGAAIVGAAETEGCDLIVMVTRGLSGMNRVLHSSVAGHVLHHSMVPLLLLRDHKVAVSAAEKEVAVSTADEEESREAIPV